MSTASPSEQSPQPGGVFRTTQWTMVLRAGGEMATDSAAALERLCRAYWQPVYVHVRRRGHDGEAARDATQEFFLRLIEGEWLRLADPKRGRFRTYLLTCLNRFLVSEWRRASSQKRGGGQAFFSLDEARDEDRTDLEPVDGETPDRAFDRRWAETVLARTTARLRSEYEASGDGARFAALKAYLIEGQEPASYADTAAALGMSVGAVRTAIFRLRQHFGETLRAELAETLATEADVDEELDYLMNVFGD